MTHKQLVEKVAEIIEVEKNFFREDEISKHILSLIAEATAGKRELPQIKQLYGPIRTAKENEYRGYNTKDTEIQNLLKGSDA